MRIVARIYLIHPRCFTIIGANRQWDSPFSISSLWVIKSYIYHFLTYNQKDFVGGFLSLLQLIVDSVGSGDLTGIIGNPIKL